MSEFKRCKGLNQKGKRCGAQAVKGSEYCVAHQDQAPKSHIKTPFYKDIKFLIPIIITIFLAIYFGSKSATKKGQQITHQDQNKTHKTLDRMEKNINKIIDNHSKASQEYLEEKYGSLPTFFGATDKGAIVPYGGNPAGINIDWKSALVLNVTHNEIKIQIPDISINTDKIKGLTFVNIKFVMIKKVGYTIAPIGDRRFEIRATVVGVDQGITVIGLSVVLKSGSSPN